MTRASLAICAACALSMAACTRSERHSQPSGGADRAGASAKRVAEAGASAPAPTRPLPASAGGAAPPARSNDPSSAAAGTSAAGGTLAPVPTSGGGAAGSEPEQSAEPEPDPVAPECAAVLADRAPPAAHCLASPEECAQVEVERERIMKWVVMARTYLEVDGRDTWFGQEELLVHQRCLVDYARRRGLGVEPDQSRPESFEVVGPRARVEALLARAGINSYQPHCLPDDCAQCVAAASERCLTDAFCGRTSGSRFDPARGCMTTQVAGCLGDSFCPDVISAAVGPDGACWVLGGCLPPGFTPGRKPECPDDIFSVPPCAAP